MYLLLASFLFYFYVWFVCALARFVVRKYEDVVPMADVLNELIGTVQVGSD